MTKRNKSCESEVMLTMQRKELLKKSAIRYAEYYGMVEVQDALYADSASEKIFTNLISIIGSDANIKMAYRNLKSNKGSSTPGVDGKTFKDLAEMSEEALVQCVRDKILNYQPKAVRRVYIPKPNGKMRPLGIPTVLGLYNKACCRSWSLYAKPSFIGTVMVSDRIVALRMPLPCVTNWRRWTDSTM